MEGKARIGIVTGTLALLAALLLLAAPPAGAIVKNVKPVRATAHALIFNVSPLRSKAIDKAWVRLSGKGRMVKKRVRAEVIRNRAAQGGDLKVKRPRSFRKGRLTVVIGPGSTTPQVPTAPADLVVGISGNTQAWGPDSGQVQDEIVSRTGAGWLREDFVWSEIEPAKNRWDFSRYDMVMTQAAERGLHVLPVLQSAPGWAAGTWNTIPSDPDAYADYVAHVVARYGTGGSFWAEHPELPADAAITTFEIWNEPYLASFSNGDADPARYARLFKAAAKAGRAQNPDAKFLIEADISATSDWSEYHDWIDSMYAAVPNLGDFFDGVAIHPYASYDPDRWDPGTPESRWQTPRMEQIHREFVSHGDGDKHMWVTEIGWPTCSGNSDCVSESKQAAYLADFFQDVSTKYRSWVDAVFVYNYADFGAGDPSDKEQWFGLTHRDGSPKPALRVFQDVTGA
jgi:hypothetical protein